MSVALELEPHAERFDRPALERRRRLTEEREGPGRGVRDALDLERIGQTAGAFARQPVERRDVRRLERRSIAEHAHRPIGDAVDEQAERRDPRRLALGLADPRRGLLEGAGHQPERVRHGEVPLAGVEYRDVVVLRLEQQVLLDLADLVEVLEVVRRLPPAQAAATQEAGAMDLLVDGREHEHDLERAALEVGERHQRRHQVHALEHHAHVLRHRALDHGADPDADAHRLLFERAQHRARRRRLAGARRFDHGALRGHLEARPVEPGQDRRREHHPHHLADGVGGVDLVDAQQRRQLDRERRLAGAGGAAEVEHERPRQPADAPHGAIARRGVPAFEPLDVIGDAAPELGVADAVDSLAQELALHLDRDAVGAVGVEAGGDQAARQQAARERLRLFTVVDDVGFARRGAGRHHGGEPLRRELGREHLGEQVVELGVGDFARLARRQPIAQGVGQRIGIVERETAQQ